MSSERRTFIGSLAGGLLTAPLAAEAQQAGKVPRVGVLLTNSQSSASTHVEAFRQGLRERGYVEGQNVVAEYRYGLLRVGSLPALQSLAGTSRDCDPSRGAGW